MNMKALVSCLTLAMCALPALAEESSSIKLAPKFMAHSATGAPWRASEGALKSSARSRPQLALISTQPEHVPGSCEISAAALCYDYRNRSSVYKPSRQFMPMIGGLQRESLVLKRDKITFRYSFK